MRNRFIRAIVIVLGAFGLGITILITGLASQIIELAASGIMIMLAGAVTSYLHLTYKDDDNKYW